MYAIILINTKPTCKSVKSQDHKKLTKHIWSEVSMSFWSL